jgi:hypothetical protein
MGWLRPRWQVLIDERQGWWGIPAPVWLLAVLAVANMVSYALIARPEFFAGSDQVFIDTLYYDEHENADIAHNLVHGRGFQFDNRPTAWREPVTPLLLALDFALFGTRYSAVLLGNGVLLVACVLLTYRICLSLFGHRAGLLGAALVAGNLYLGRFAAWPLSEVVSFVSWLAWFAALLRWQADDGRRPPLAVGIWFAVLVLGRGTMVGLAPVVAWVVWRQRRQVLPVIVAFLPLTLGVGTWAARNAVTMHAVIPLTTKLGPALYYDNAREDLDTPFWAPYGMTVPTNAENQAVLGEWTTPYVPIQEVAYSQKSLAEVKRQIAATPDKYLLRSLRRFIAYYSPYMDFMQGRARLAQAAKWCLVVMPGLVGLWRFRRAPWLAGPAGTIVLLTAVHTLITGDEMHRYRIPLEAPLAILAAGLLAGSQWPRRTQELATAHES